jgi:hypothetical protein
VIDCNSGRFATESRFPLCVSQASSSVIYVSHCILHVVGDAALTTIFALLSDIVWSRSQHDVSSIIDVVIGNSSAYTARFHIDEVAKRYF